LEVIRALLKVIPATWVTLEVIRTPLEVIPATWAVLRGDPGVLESPSGYLGGL
jgi:hypothetical protein